jgi:hypothetical protein
MKDYDSGALAFGMVFIALGLLFLLDAYDVVDLRARHIWAILLIGIGIGVLFGGRGQTSSTD